MEPTNDGRGGPEVNGFVDRLSEDYRTFRFGIGAKILRNLGRRLSAELWDSGDGQACELSITTGVSTPDFLFFAYPGRCRGDCSLPQRYHGGVCWQ